jgi:zinc transport system ATP-binding protein
MSIISIKNLSFSYDKDIILDNINLDVDENDFLAIIGPNGGGKSTLVKNILGLLTPKEGQIIIFNDSQKKYISKIGYVPQNTNININFPITVLEVVMMGHIRDKTEENKSKNFLHKYFKIGYNEFEKSCALSALKQVGMDEYANQKIGSLSGGQRQRVMIARALCNHPSILILDEPTASIDVEGQKQIYELLKELNRHITIIVISHDISLTMQYANKVAHINKRLNFHDISHTKTNILDKNEHFCEIEMLELLGGKTIHHEGCGC